MTAVQTDTGDGDQRRTFRPWDRSHDAEVLDVLDVLDVPDDLEEPDDLASRFADEEPEPRALIRSKGWRG